MDRNGTIGKEWKEPCHTVGFEFGGNEVCYVVELAGDARQSVEEEFGGKEGHDAEENIVDEQGFVIIGFIVCDFLIF